MEKLQRDGVALAYMESGRGEPPIVVVHGWTCNHTYFAPQADYFGRSHRVIAVDLRGHGQSDKPRQDYTLAVFADDLVWLCEQLRIQKPVIIGHSLGGVIAFELAARYPDLPAAVVAIDSPLVQRPRFRARIAGLVEQLRGQDYRLAAQDFVRGMFVPSDDKALQARIVEEMSSAPQHVMTSAMEQMLAFGADAVASLELPALAITCDHRGPLAGTAIKELNPAVMVGQVIGAGHFAQLVVPEQVNAMLGQFLKVGVPTSVTR